MICHNNRKKFLSKLKFDRTQVELKRANTNFHVGNHKHLSKSASTPTQNLLRSLFSSCSGLWNCCQMLHWQLSMWQFGLVVGSIRKLLFWKYSSGVGIKSWEENLFSLVNYLKNKTSKKRFHCWGESRLCKFFNVLIISICQNFQVATRKKLHRTLANEKSLFQSPIPFSRLKD